MNYLYVDNYRGFQNTFVPIKDVNFLVGENSSGKTSILSLIELLSPDEVWFKRELSTKKVGLGNFKDIVSISSDNKKSFWVGMIFDSFKNVKDDYKSEKEKNYNPLVVILRKFIEHDGMPRLASFIYYKDGESVHINFIGNKIKYKVDSYRISEDAVNFCGDKFNNWMVERCNDNNGFKYIDNEIYFNEDAPPIMIVSIIRQNILKDKKKRPSFTLDSICNEMIWLAPIRSKPRKTYDEFSLEFTPEGDHTPYLIKKQLSSKSGSQKFKKYLRDVGLESGLFKEVKIRNYGRGVGAPFQLDVVLDEHPLGVGSVGYGVSQALPVIVEVFSREENTWFAIQQPEVHLHPKAQAALGELFFKLSSLQNKKFVIETHSDYTIDRFRICLKKGELVNNPKSQIIFFERDGKENKIYPIEIYDNGDLSEDQPPSYREFFLKEEMNLLGL